MIELKDEDILLRLTNFEDAFVERKSTGDMRDLLKTAVAFANSTPIGYPSILFYGVTDKGVPEGKANLDSLEKTISEKLAEAYPPIYYLPKVFSVDGKQFLAVIIPGSDNRPHFAGQSYIREGSQTKGASEQQFERLVAERNSMAREILKWKGNQITVKVPPYQYMMGGTTCWEKGYTHSAFVSDCNQFYVTLRVIMSKEDVRTVALPLSKVEVSFDTTGAGRLCLIINVKGWLL
jgi:hypothetical protein